MYVAGMIHFTMGFYSGHIGISCQVKSLNPKGIFKIIICLLHLMNILVRP